MNRIDHRTGPLAGITVLEVGGIGAVPVIGMLLADLGATVIRVDRPGDLAGLSDASQTFRDRRSIEIDLRATDGVPLLLRLVERADVLLEAWRPGVAERLGIGPEVCLARNPMLIYGRMTGWGADGPLAHKGGHDINYISITGALHAIGPAGEPPAIPLNLIGDYGGGAMMLVMGVLAALVERRTSSRGQVVEAAMVDGALALLSEWQSWRDQGRWRDERERNLIDGGAPFYRTYETSDGKYMAVGAIEPKFYSDLLAGLGSEKSLAATQMDEQTWPALRDRFAGIFRQRSQQEWEDTFAELDACVTPVVSLADAPAHPHNAARGRFLNADGHTFIAPPVRFSRTPADIHAGPPERGEHTREVLAALGLSDEEIDQFYDRGVLGARSGTMAIRPD